MAHAPFASMAMREFVDDADQRWMAWDIRPEESHPITRFEDYLQGYLDGWLVFETPDGHQRRRLHPIPRGWAELPDAELKVLFDRAEPAPPPGARLSSPRSTERSDAPGSVVRSFLYPGGRLWTVAEVPTQYRDPDGTVLGESRTVLRFSAGRRTLDLLAWPREWVDFDEEQLAALLCRAFPRQTHVRPENAPARRRSDARAEP